MANYPSKFTYEPEWPALEGHLRDALSHDHDAPGTTPGADPLDALVMFLTQRDRQIEDYLGNLKGATPPIDSHASGLADAITVTTGSPWGGSGWNWPDTQGSDINPSTSGLVLETPGIYAVQLAMVIEAMPTVPSLIIFQATVSGVGTPQPPSWLLPLHGVSPIVGGASSRFTGPTSFIHAVNVGGVSGAGALGFQCICTGVGANFTAGFLCNAVLIQTSIGTGTQPG